MNDSKRLWKHGIPVIFLSLVLITITQDFLAAVLLDRGFYFSESFLFKLIWLLFIPAAVIFWTVVSVHVDAGKKYLINSSLRQITETLDTGIFVRIHRSTIVNVQRIQALHSRSNGDYDVILHDGTVLRWSRNYHAALKKVLTLA